MGVVEVVVECPLVLVEGKYRYLFVAVVVEEHGLVDDLDLVDTVRHNLLGTLQVLDDIVAVGMVVVAVFVVVVVAAAVVGELVVGFDGMVVGVFFVVVAGNGRCSCYFVGHHTYCNLSQVGSVVAAVVVLAAVAGTGLVLVVQHQ